MKDGYVISVKSNGKAGATPNPARLAKKLGFPKLEPVTSMRSIAHLFGLRKKRCGVYLLGFSSGEFYIGQAKEVVHRFAAHRRNYSNIEWFGFIPVEAQRLDSTEQTLIYRAEQMGLVLLNVVFASQVVGDTDLDLVLSPEQQDQWLTAPASFNSQDTADPLVLPITHRARCADRFQKFQVHPLEEAVLKILRLYILNCIPSPVRTEYSFWAVSCLPATNRNTWPRLACVNMGVMETLVVGYIKGDPKTLWGFVNVASDVFLDSFGSKAQFGLAFPNVELRKRGYRDAGQHQLSVHADGYRDLLRLLQSRKVQRSAAALALRVMRKRATIYGKFHCKQLVSCPGN